MKILRINKKESNKRLLDPTLSAAAALPMFRRQTFLVVLAFADSALAARTDALLSLLIFFLGIVDFTDSFLPDPLFFFSTLFRTDITFALLVDSFCAWAAFNSA